MKRQMSKYPIMGLDRVLTEAFGVPCMWIQTKRELNFVLISVYVGRELKDEDRPMLHELMLTYWEKFSLVPITRVVSSQFSREGRGSTVSVSLSWGEE